MRATSIVSVARYLLLDRVTYLVLPWGWAAFGFLLDVVIMQVTPAGDGGPRWVGGLSGVFLVVFALGLQAVARALPFGLTLGVSRRTYFLGAVTLATALAVSFGLLVAIGQTIERATGGWGLNMAYFRLPGVLDGAWWQTWLTASAAFVLLYAYGMWYGLVYRRGGLEGVVFFGAAQATVLALIAVLTAWAHDWARIGHFLSTSAASYAPVILAGLTMILLAGGLATLRRLPV